MDPLDDDLESSEVTIQVKVKDIQPYNQIAMTDMKEKESKAKEKLHEASYLLWEGAKE